MTLVMALNKTTKRWLSRSAWSPAPLYKATANPCVASESQEAGSDTHILCISNRSCHRALRSRMPEHVYRDLIFTRSWLPQGMECLSDFLISRGCAKRLKHWELGDNSLSQFRQDWVQSTRGLLGLSSELTKGERLETFTRNPRHTHTYLLLPCLLP